MHVTSSSSSSVAGQPGKDTTPASKGFVQGDDLHAQVAQLRQERDRLEETQRQIMELLGVTSPERLMHDLRNLLNERALLRALTADDDNA